MNEIHDSLGRLMAAVSAILRARLAERPELPAFVDLAALPAEPSAASPASNATDLPVMRHLGAALGAADGDARPLADLVANLAPALRFAQNPNYRAAPPSPQFLDNYGYAVFAGPADGPPALWRTPSLAFGLLLLGPHTEYPPHHHPAIEVYIPLGPAEWRSGEGGWRFRSPGDVVYHAPNVLHATRAGKTPLAALYLWRGDLATYARLA